MGKSAVIIDTFALHYKYLEMTNWQSVFIILSWHLKFEKKFYGEPLADGQKWVYDCKIDNKKGEFR